MWKTALYSIAASLSTRSVFGRMIGNPNYVSNSGGGAGDRGTTVECVGSKEENAMPDRETERPASTEKAVSEAPSSLIEAAVWRQWRKEPTPTQGDRYAGWKPGWDPVSMGDEGTMWVQFEGGRLEKLRIEGKLSGERHGEYWHFEEGERKTVARMTIEVDERRLIMTTPSGKVEGFPGRWATVTTTDGTTIKYSRDASTVEHGDYSQQRFAEPKITTVIKPGEEGIYLSYSPKSGEVAGIRGDGWRIEHLKENRWLVRKGKPAGESAVIEVKFDIDRNGNLFIRDQAGRPFSTAGETPVRHLPSILQKVVTDELKESRSAAHASRATGAREGSVPPVREAPSRTVSDAPRAELLDRTRVATGADGTIRVGDHSQGALIERGLLVDEEVRRLTRMARDLKDSTKESERNTGTMLEAVVAELNGEHGPDAKQRAHREVLSRRTSLESMSEALRSEGQRGTISRGAGTASGIAILATAALGYYAACKSDAVQPLRRASVGSH